MTPQAYSSTDWLLIVLGMMVVTYIPRLVPTAWLAGRTDGLPRWLRRWLSLLPPAALGALIWPGVAQSVPGLPWIGVAGAAAAVLIAAATRANLAAVVAGTAVVTGLLLYVWG